MYFESNSYSNYVQTLTAAFDIMDAVRHGNKQERFDFVFKLKGCGESFMGASLFSHYRKNPSGLTVLEHILKNNLRNSTYTELLGMDDWQIDMICEALGIPNEGDYRTKIENVLLASDKLRNSQTKVGEF